MAELLSIVVPCFNEEDALPLFYEKIITLKEQLPSMDFEYILIDDGSGDHTYQKMRCLQEQDGRVKLIRFSRNFGKEAAIFSGLNRAKGDCCVVMDADLQHPVEAIPGMVELWREGYEVIEGIKSDRGRESRCYRTFANVFYGLLSRFMGMDMRNSSDFKLMDRKVVDTLCSLKERNTFFRALSFWTGYKSTTITYQVSERAAGTAQWSKIILIKYGLKNLISFSFMPLYLILFVGAVLFLFALILSIDAVISAIQGSAIGGYPTLLIFLAFISSGLMMSLGIIGVYIALIYDEVKGRPRYIVRDEKGFAEKQNDDALSKKIQKRESE